MTEIVAEFIGTTILIFLGNGVVANVLLRNTKGNNAGWIVITAGWGCAVAVAVMCVGHVSGAHLNPAVTLGFAAANEFAWSLVPGYVIAQMSGAMFGAALVYGFYKPHYDITKDPDLKLATFCTAPQIRNVPNNLLCEVLATFVLVYAALVMSEASFTLNGGEEIKVGLGAVGAFPIGLVVFTIGICVGGTTGYAINPVRDLGPRVVHQLLPIKDKRDSDWSYAMIPVIGPCGGGLLAAAIYFFTRTPDESVALNILDTLSRTAF